MKIINNFRSFTKKIIRNYWHRFKSLQITIMIKIIYNNPLYSFLMSKKFVFFLKAKHKIDIISSQHTLFVAKILQKFLKKLHINSEIIIVTLNQNVYFKSDFYILLCGNILKTIPKNFFLFNFEQTVYTRWFNKKYNYVIAKSVALLDYSINNIKYFNNKFKYKKTFYVPLCIDLNIFQMSFKKNNRILFYGDDSQSRRKNILNRLKDKYPIDIYNNCFEDEMNKKLNDYKIVLNIHSDDNGNLETCRIYESISHGCIVVSEDSIDCRQYDDILKNAIFFKTGEFDKLDDIFKTLLNSNTDYYFDKNSLFNNIIFSFNCFKNFLRYFKCF